MLTPVVRLTDAERAILDSYCAMVEGLSEYLGDSFEIVVHTLENLDASAIKVINGHYTGREEGAPITDLALTMLARMRENGSPSHITYFAKNKRDEPVKSCTIAIRGQGGRTIGLLCMNMYLNTPLSTILEGLTGQPDTTVQENFAADMDEVVERAVREAVELVAQNTALPKSGHNKEIIRRLHEQGIFQMKNAVPIVSERMGISRNTVYLHLRALEK